MGNAPNLPTLPALPDAAPDLTDERMRRAKAAGMLAGTMGQGRKSSFTNPRGMGPAPTAAPKSILGG
jgi:hypothetical protein